MPTEKLVGDVFSQPIARMQQASGVAAPTLLKMMFDPNSPAASRVRAAHCILDDATKGLELQDIEARVSQLEGSLPTSKSDSFR
jgi:hypothetical protein